MLIEHKALFEAVTIGKLDLANRVALAPTYVGMGDGKGNITDQNLCYYYARSAGGCGLIIVEATGVTGRYAFAPSFGFSASHDVFIPGLRDLARVIHWGGAKAVIQLAPGVGCQALRSYENRPLVGPSDVPAVIREEGQEGLPKALRVWFPPNFAPERPRPLSLDEIEYLKGAMVKASLRAQRAGFDGIEIHGAHGYLLAQFTSPYFNRRDDDYGGTPEKRWRFSVEMVREIKDSVQEKFIVGYRFSAREGIPGGLDMPESIEMAKAVADAGADYLSVSQGCPGARTPVAPHVEGVITEDAAAVKKAVSIPVICPNFQNPDLAAEAVSSGSVDMVALSRALLSDPLWVKKVREGSSETIQPCVRCYQCVRALNVDRLPVRCSVNPMLGFERFDPDCFPRPIRSTLKKAAKKAK